MYDELATLIEQILGAETPESLREILALHDLAATESAMAEAATALLASDDPEALAGAEQIADALDIVRAEAALRVTEAEDKAATTAAVKSRLAGANKSPMDEPDGRDHTPDPDDASGDAPNAKKVGKKVGTPGYDADSTELATESDETEEADDVEVAAVETPAVPAPAPRPALSALSRLAPADTAPREPERDQRVSITASADVPGVSIGTELGDLRTVAEAVIARQEMLGKGRSSNIELERLPIVRFNYLDSLRQVGEDMMLNGLMLLEAGRPDAMEPFNAMTASGGFCAPAEVVYDFVKVNTPTDLVQNWLPVVGAPRGSIQYPTSPDIRDAFTNNVTRSYSNADDIAGTHKVTAVIACPTFNTCTVGAQYVILQFGNFGTRAYPEWVEHWLGLSMDAHAHKLSSKLIVQMMTLSNAAVAVGPNGGATGTIFGNIAMAAADMRHDLRMGRSAQLEIVFPAWVYSLIRSDLARARKSTLETLNVSDAEIDSWFASNNLTLRLVEDWQDISGTATVGASVWPSGLDFLLYPPGTFIKLDQGTLDLGVVRDSVLNATNDYNIFVESFESVCKPGIESRLYSVSICANGAFSADQNLNCSAIDIPGS